MGGKGTEHSLGGRSIVISKHYEYYILKTGGWFENVSIPNFSLEYLNSKYRLVSKATSDLCPTRYAGKHIGYQKTASWHKLLFLGVALVSPSNFT